MTETARLYQIRATYPQCFHCGPSMKLLRHNRNHAQGPGIHDGSIAGLRYKRCKYPRTVDRVTHGASTVVEIAGRPYGPKAGARASPAQCGSPRSVLTRATRARLRAVYQLRYRPVLAEPVLQQKIEDSRHREVRSFAEKSAFESFPIMPMSIRSGLAYPLNHSVRQSVVGRHGPRSSRWGPRVTCRGCTTGP
jgi:hypothetical protein